MIFVDIDGTLIDFIGTARKFGIELAVNDFSTWRWGVDGFPTPEEFYAEAQLQPWVESFIIAIRMCGGSFIFITKDFAKDKSKFISSTALNIKTVLGRSIVEAPNKSIRCLNPCDLLIDDNIVECEAWRKKGGIAYHFDLSEYYKNGADPFAKFLAFWHLKNTHDLHINN